MTEESGDAFPARSYDPSKYPSFAVTADIAVFTLAEAGLQILLVQRGGRPFEGCWALPGGFVHPDESLDQAAARELEEETGVRDAGPLEQLGAYGDPGRDPRMRVVTVCYVAIVPNLPEPRGGSDAARADLHSVAELEAGRLELAFDHGVLVADAIEHLRSSLEEEPLATAFCEAEFTLAELRSVYERIWGVELDSASFRRKVLSMGEFLVPASRQSSRKKPSPGGARRGSLYRKGRAKRLDPPFRRPS